MFFKKQICPKCKTGQQTYVLDKSSVECPHIACWKNGKCSFYVTLEKDSRSKKKRTLSDIFFAKNK